MKTQRLGPFDAVRWFCEDGTILEPKPYACEEDHGGGVQHGQWSKRTQAIRDAGYPIANIMTELSQDDFIGPKSNPILLELILLERFLMSYDDGWIMRKARFVRGILQTHNEDESTAEILNAMIARPRWYERNYLVLYEAVRLLPHGAESADVLTEIRGLSSAIAEKDEAFVNLKNKIHSNPAAEDAQRIRQYIRENDRTHQDYKKLAKQIEQAYGDAEMPMRLRKLARRKRGSDIARDLNQRASDFEKLESPSERMALAARTAAMLRENIKSLRPSSIRLGAMDVVTQAGISFFISGTQLSDKLNKASVAELLNWMTSTTYMLYAEGMLDTQEKTLILKTLEQMQKNERAAEAIDIANLSKGLLRLERVPGWAQQRLHRHFDKAINHFKRIEPMVELYIPDRLRGGAMLFYAQTLDSLKKKISRASGIEHDLFGEKTSLGLQALNPGLAHGILRSPADLFKSNLDHERGIYLLPETTAELPRVAGILTQDAGNALSHVQLLARNLGIPNAVVDASVIEQVMPYVGEHVVMAVSPGGIVQLDQYDAKWKAIFDATEKPEALTLPLHKLDLTDTELVPTARLSTYDSGRSVGPKAAQVGELTHRYPGMVSPGLAIPFGVFRNMLERPAWPVGPRMFDLMQVRYDALEAQKKLDPEGHKQRLSGFLQNMRDWIMAQPHDPEFVETLRKQMSLTFGQPGTYGVFVRSDTNVEDLPNFTGAGLNKTVHHVTEFEKVLEAIKTVWASPFSERAFLWRQDQLDTPEHVYCSILLHQSVPAEKSGVLVTADIDNGDMDYSTVVTNLGVGGGVDGLAAETIKIDMITGETQLITPASDTQKRVLLPEGGSKMVPAKAPKRVLLDKEIEQLLNLARKVQREHPGLTNDDGKRLPADIEFGFLDGKLWLFQIRPFDQGERGNTHPYLREMDEKARQAYEKRNTATFDNNDSTDNLREQNKAAPVDRAPNDSRPPENTAPAETPEQPVNLVEPSGNTATEDNVPASSANKPDTDQPKIQSRLESGLQRMKSILLESDTDDDLIGPEEFSEVPPPQKSGDQTPE